MLLETAIPGSITDQDSGRHFDGPAFMAAASRVASHLTGRPAYVVVAHGGPPRSSPTCLAFGGLAPAPFASIPP